MTPAPPFFEIITVCYNAADTIERTILSVLSQMEHLPYGTLVHTFIDGGSTDGTQDIIKRYHPLGCLSEPDKGLYDAMNKGLRGSYGTYLCFLNAGDTFHEPDTLCKLMDALRHCPDMPDVVYGETALVDGEGHFLRMRRLRAPETLTWRSFKQGMLVCHQAFFVQRDLVADGFWGQARLLEPYDLQYRFSADFDWCVRVLKKAAYTYNTHLTLIDYLDEGLTTRNRKASLKERFRIMVRHYGWWSTVWHHAWFVVRALINT